MPDSDDIETRLASVERDVARLREQVALSSSDAAAARVLAAGADRDVSEVRAELRAHTQSLNALRETQLEQGREITSLRQDVTSLRQDVASRDERCASRDGRCARVSPRWPPAWHRSPRCSRTSQGRSATVTERTVDDDEPTGHR